MLRKALGKDRFIFRTDGANGQFLLMAGIKKVSEYTSDRVLDSPLHHTEHPTKEIIMLPYNKLTRLNQLP